MSSESSDIANLPTSSTPNPDLHFIVEKRLKNNTVKTTRYLFEKNYFEIGNFFGNLYMYLMIMLTAWWK